MKYILKADPIHISITPYGFYSFAFDYYNTAKKASEIDFKKRINYPAYFLYCRSIELAIKAILLASKKYSISEIKTHDFSKLLPKLDRTAKKLLMISDSDVKMLLILDKWYKTDQKRFEYFSLDTSGIFPINSNIYPGLPTLKEIDKLTNYMLNPGVIKFVTT